MRRFSLLLAVTLCMGFFMPHVCEAQPATREVLSILQERTKNLMTLHSTFTQETNIPMFSRPVVSHGRLLFQKPDSLRWEYLSPLREGFVIVGGKGFRWEEDARSAFSAGKDPVATLIAGQLLAWIRFDVAQIEREYHIEALSADPISLKMTPISKDMGSVITSITITFSAEGAASSVRLAEGQGGTTTITFTGTVLNAVLNSKDFR